MDEKAVTWNEISFLNHCKGKLVPSWVRVCIWGFDDFRGSLFDEFGSGRERGRDGRRQWPDARHGHGPKSRSPVGLIFSLKPNTGETDALHFWPHCAHSTLITCHSLQVQQIFNSTKINVNWWFDEWTIFWSITGERVKKIYFDHKFQNSSYST